LKLWRIKRKKYERTKSGKMNGEDMNQVNIQYYKTKIGELVLGSFQNRLCMLDFRYRTMRQTVDKRIKTGLEAEFLEKDDKLLQKTRGQIDEFLNGKRKRFDIPILTIGTSFQRLVWKTLMDITYGQTATYLDLAKKVGNKKAVRAVASANGANTIGLIIPCHRIILSNGQLGGYAGGLSAKRKLLNIERQNSVLSEQIHF